MGMTEVNQGPPLILALTVRECSVHLFILIGLNSPRTLGDKGLFSDGTRTMIFGLGFILHNA